MIAYYFGSQLKVLDPKLGSISSRQKASTRIAWVIACSPIFLCPTMSHCRHYQNRKGQSHLCVTRHAKKQGCRLPPQCTPYTFLGYFFLNKKIREHFLRIRAGFCRRRLWSLWRWYTLFVLWSSDFLSFHPNFSEETTFLKHVLYLLKVKLIAWYLEKRIAWSRDQRRAWGSRKLR